MAIDISNYVQVAISTTPSSLAKKNMGVIAIFTKETPIYPINVYKVYKNPNSCASDWGINSTTYKMVNSVYMQNLNVLSNDGYVVVIPMLTNTTIPATNGYVLLEKLIYNKFLSVKDGSFKIAVDENEAVEITNLDFSACQTLPDVANVIQEALITANVACTLTSEATKITFVSNSTGASSKIVLSAGESGTDITTLDYLNIAQGITKNGEAEYVGVERLQDAIIRTKLSVWYESILTSYRLTKDEILNAAPIVQADIRMMYATSNSTTSFTGIFKTVKEKGYTKCRCLYNGMNEEFIFSSGYASKLQSVNFEGSETANTLQAKEIIGLTPDDTLDDNLLLQAVNAGVDTYPRVETLGAVYESGENEWSDTVLFLNWLQNALQVAGFNALRQVPTKIAQTEKGIQLLDNTYTAVLEQAVRLGYVGAGTWTLPFTFGDQKKFYNNIEQVGYYLYFTPLSEQSAEARSKRKAPAGMVAVKLQGAVHTSDLTVFINN